MNELLPVNFRFFLRSLQDALLDGSFADQPVNRDLLCLSQPVRSVHCLLVDGGIPVAVKIFSVLRVQDPEKPVLLLHVTNVPVVENDRVSSGEIDAEASSAGRKQEDEDV